MYLACLDGAAFKCSVPVFGGHWSSPILTITKKTCWGKEAPPLAENLQSHLLLLTQLTYPYPAHLPSLCGAQNSQMLALHRGDGMAFCTEPPSTSLLYLLHFPPVFPEGLESTQPWKPWDPSVCLLRNPVQSTWVPPRFTQFQFT